MQLWWSLAFVSASLTHCFLAFDEYKIMISWRHPEFGFDDRDVLIMHQIIYTTDLSVNVSGLCFYQIIHFFHHPLTQLGTVLIPFSLGSFESIMGSFHGGISACSVQSNYQANLLQTACNWKWMVENLEDGPWFRSCFGVQLWGEDFQFDQCLLGSFNPTTVSSYGFNRQLVTVGRLLGGGFKVFF